MYTGDYVCAMYVARAIRSDSVLEQSEAATVANVPRQAARLCRKTPDCGRGAAGWISAKRYYFCAVPDRFEAWGLCAVAHHGSACLFHTEQATLRDRGDLLRWKFKAHCEQWTWIRLHTVRVCKGTHTRETGVSDAGV